MGDREQESVGSVPEGQGNEIDRDEGSVHPTEVDQDAEGQEMTNAEEDKVKRYKDMTPAERIAVYQPEQKCREAEKEIYAVCRKYITNGEIPAWRMRLILQSLARNWSGTVYTEQFKHLNDVPDPNKEKL